MASPASEPLTDIPPAARDTVASLFAAPTVPVKVLVSGGIGTGKTSVLAAIRSALRAAEVTVLTTPPKAGGDSAAAVVIDDAHLLDDAELGRLAELVADPASTVVVAAEPLVHHGALRSLTTAIERENPVVSLGAFSPAEVNRLTAETLGAPPTSEIIRSLMVATAGLPFLLRPTIAAAGSPDGEAPATAIMQAAKFALIERLRRLDEPVLDTLLVSSLSPELGPDDVAAALRVGAADAQGLVDRARASGLIEPSHSHAFLRSVHHCIAGIIGNARHHDIEISLLVSQLESSTLSADLALRMAEHGLRDDRLATALADLASRTRGQQARAARLYRAAADAGATALSTRLADALALTGDCTAAGRLADELLGSGDQAERAAAVRIAASIAVHDGSATQAADLFRWLGPHPDAFVSAAGAIVTVAAGDVDAARAALSAESAGPPTSTARAARSLAEGLLLSLDQPFPIAVARLGQSITAEQPTAGVAPDTPAALVTLAALHGGDPVRARSVIGRAVRAGSQPDGADETFSSHRHRLLLGWVRMQDGQLSAAAADVASTADAALHRRDALWAAALQTAIARRSGDSGAVQKHWYAAMEVLAEYSVDLFSLMPLAELWVAAARMRQVDRLQHTLTEAFALLDSLGRPVLWSMPLHWAGVHAGILANSPEAVAPHGQALTAAAAHSAFAKALSIAGRTWLRVLANHVDIDEVTAAARGLSQFGLTWDGTRLASQAALQTPDGRVSGAMLQLARDLKQTVAVDEAPDVESMATVADAARTGPSRPASSRLSDREREVAELLLLGMPYKDIGSQLFISAKTVEHHVARIRRRLGAESRSEMLSMLRAMLAHQG
jgi:DNA-binding CsgD family transcriptional regulator